MFKRIIFVLFILWLSECSTSHSSDIYVQLQKKLYEVPVSEGELFLVLFVSEEMCSECISKKFININQLNFSKPIVIVGVFDKKRYFQSCINIISKKCILLYISKKEYSSHNLPTQPFYCVFDRQSQSIIKNILATSL